MRYSMDSKTLLVFFYSLSSGKDITFMKSPLDLKITEYTKRITLASLPSNTP